MSTAMQRRRQVLVWTGALSAAAWMGAPQAQSSGYPTKPVTLIVPYTAGGSTDVVARLVAQKLTERLGQSFVVENKPGANAVIGIDAAARAKPDGYTLLLNTAGGQTLAPQIYKTHFDALNSWEPISLISSIPFVIVARDGLPAKDWAEFVKLAKSSADKPLSAASGSSLVVLITDALKHAIGAPDLLNIQYKGTAMQAQAVIKGEVDFSVDSFVTKPQIQAGRVKPLAVIAPHRVASLPNVPTLEELGVKNMEFASWSALLAPKGTPPEIVKKLDEEMRVIVKLPEVQEKLKGFDHTPVGTGPAELTKLIKEDSARWQQIIKATGFKIDG